mmetsp:Transcript_7607/g.20617  ORF Transcript_7607/g.20617 Transcript_7607/m.20617 type:complete len:95 (+) Transcript_7607:317-601(+)
MLIHRQREMESHALHGGTSPHNCVSSSIHAMAPRQSNNCIKTNANTTQREDRTKHIPRGKRKQRQNRSKATTRARINNGEGGHERQNMNHSRIA